MGVKLVWRGRDISDVVNVTACVHQDACAGQCDLLTVEMDHADKWFRWAPQMDDTVQVSRDGYASGTLYLSAILPERDTYRVFATSLRGKRQSAAYKSWEETTLAAVAADCAAMCGMGVKFYGVNGGTTYKYMLMNGERPAAFLERLAHMEGAILKAVNGSLCLIDVDWAQGLAPSATMHIYEKRQPNVTHENLSGQKWAQLQIYTPYGEATAADASAAFGGNCVKNLLPVRDQVTAWRWANGTLKTFNRQNDRLTVTNAEFLPALTAMAHVRVEGDTDANGDWLAECVTQDLYNRRTSAELVRFV